jgi:hypothetical protein
LDEAADFAGVAWAAAGVEVGAVEAALVFTGPEAGSEAGAAAGPLAPGFVGAAEAAAGCAVAADFAGVAAAPVLAAGLGEGCDAAEGDEGDLLTGWTLPG